MYIICISETGHICNIEGHREYTERHSESVNLSFWNE
jgi:hypothetical protein